MEEMKELTCDIRGRVIEREEWTRAAVLEKLETSDTWVERGNLSETN